MKSEEILLALRRDHLIKLMEERVERKSDTGCWNWLGGKLKGYGHITLHIDGRSLNISTHRLSYALHYGTFPIHTVDHLCRNKACCNPAHLEDVTNTINSFRNRTAHCKRGHERTPENTYHWISREGWHVRICRICRNEHDRRRRRERNEH